MREPKMVHKQLIETVATYSDQSDAIHYAESAGYLVRINNGLHVAIRPEQMNDTTKWFYLKPTTGGYVWSRSK